MEITTILVVVNIVVSALSPVIQMIGRIRHSKCLGAEMDVGTPTPQRSQTSEPNLEQFSKTS